MRLLLHIGLNKCASTFIQGRLAASRDHLARCGTCYPRAGGRTAHYGLSAAYGFGPEGVAPLPLDAHLAEARRAGAERLVLSSEYLSLARPKAIASLAEDIAAAGLGVEVLLFARPVVPWVRSLFNQYVKTVEGGRWLPNIDAFVDQVLGNRAIDIAARYRAWERVVGAERIRLVDISPDAPRDAVLAPFEGFARLSLDRAAGPAPGFPATAPPAGDGGGDRTDAQRRVPGGSAPASPRSAPPRPTVSGTGHSARTAADLPVAAGIVADPVMPGDPVPGAERTHGAGGPGKDGPTPFREAPAGGWSSEEQGHPPSTSGTAGTEAISRHERRRGPPRKPPDAAPAPSADVPERQPRRAEDPEGNRSLSPGALYLTGLLLRAPRSTARDRALAAARRAVWLPAPPSYLRIGPERLARLAEEIEGPFAELPRRGPPPPFPSEPGDPSLRDG